MDVAEIRRLGRGVNRCLAEFTDCFGRCDTESYLGVYVEGQSSDLHRKSAEPMALRSGIPPRSLQAFLGLLSWDEERLVDRLQEIVVRDHHHEHAIGLVDETGIPKKGRHTAGVQRQWCGNTGTRSEERHVQDATQRPTRPHWLFVTRDPQQVEQAKFFVSNANPGCPVEWLAYVGYSRWPIEQCFKEEKDELGFDHFEVRSWRAIRRHMVLTQVSHLYLNKMRLQRMAQERRQEEASVFPPANHERRAPDLPRTKPHRQSTSRRDVRVVPGGGVRVSYPQTHAGAGRTADQLYPTPKRQGSSQPSKNNNQETANHRYQNQTNTNLRWK